MNKKIKTSITFLIGYVTFASVVLFFMYFKNITDRTIYPYETYNNFITFSTTGKLYFVAITGLIYFIFIMIFSFKNLNSLKSKKVGDGQHGTAKWADDKEIKSTYKVISHFKDKQPGWVVGTLNGNLLIDTKDNNVLVVSPPSKGKTKSVIYPNMINSFYNDEFVFGTDTKGKTYPEMSEYALTLGYKCIHLNFRNCFSSHRYNFMATVNKYMDRALVADDHREKLLANAAAEKYAKILSNAIVKSTHSSAGANQYFYDVAQGIITSIILLVSEYGDQKDRHIVSVLRIVAESMKSQEVDNESRTKLFYLFEMIDGDDKFKWYAEAGTNSDIRTAMNTFSTALSRLLEFIDTEIEQMICFETDFDVEDLFESEHKQKHFVVVNIPEENQSRHFIGTLLINVVMSELLEKGSNSPNGRLPFVTRVYADEFGTMPAIPNIESMFTAGRERQLYFMPIIQSFDQLNKNYQKERANIISKSCQMTYFSGLATGQYDEAKRLSEAIGKETILSGSISRKNSNLKMYNPGQISEQMQGKPLIFPDEILKLGMGEWIVLRSGSNPMKTKLKMYSDYKLPKVHEVTPLSIEIKEPSYMRFDELYKRASIKSKRLNQDFDDVQIIDAELEVKDDTVIQEIEIPGHLKELYAIFFNRNDIEGINLIKNGDQKSLIEKLYLYHRQDIIDGDYFIKLRNMLTYS